MRIALISDVHGNKPALDAVLNDIRESARVDELWFLGDAVGYGPMPVECFEALKDAADIFIRGNHDTALFDPDTRDDLNPKARIAIEWTLGVVSQDQVDEMRKFPAFKLVEQHDALLSHASPFEREKWHYIFTPQDAQKAFEAADNRIIFTGHSHIPGAFVLEKKTVSRQVLREGTLKLHTKARYILNPGAVGQPRDGEPLAAYGIFDTKTLKFTVRRVKYDVNAVASAIASAGLPQYLAERLFLGL